MSEKLNSKRLQKIGIEVLEIFEKYNATPKEILILVESFKDTFKTYGKMSKKEGTEKQTEKELYFDLIEFFSNKELTPKTMIKSLETFLEFCKKAEEDISKEVNYVLNKFKGNN